MSQLSLVCLSLTPNLRCVGFTLGQFETLIIPPVIEVVISLLFIFLYSGPARWAQISLALDGILYFIWALVDMSSHVAPAARDSQPVFKALDSFVGAVSFTPVLVYLFYLYQLSIHDFIPTLSRKLQWYLEILLPVLLLVAVVINEASSFVGTFIGTTSDQHPLVEFSHNSESLWYSLSLSSLAIYAITQFLFFLLAFSRLSKAIVDKRRIELTHSGERHHFNGIAWITAGIITGVIETIAGFARVSFGVALARRIIRMGARAILMYGLLKGLDVAEDLETLTDELRGVSHISRRISRMLGINPVRINIFRRISQSYSEQPQEDKCVRVSAEKQSRDQRVTAHCERGQAPFLQIRFSTLDFPAQAASEQRRRSLSGCIPGAGGGAQQHGENVSDEMAAARNAMLQAPRAKSELVAAGSNHLPPDWIQPPERNHAWRGSGATISDNTSIVRELERKFPNLPPRVTGKYRGSILGENYQEDPFPVVGISRQSSLRRDGPQNSSEDGGANITLSPSGSIKRKPAPPLLENITYISSQQKRPASTWGGLNQNAVRQPVDSPVSYTPAEGATVYGPESPVTAEPSTPRSRRMTARDVIKRVSRAMSDVSIRSAEWLASVDASRSGRTQITASDIEMYRRGNVGPGPAHPKPGTSETLLPSAKVPPKTRRSSDDAGTNSKPTRPRSSTRASIGEIPMPTSSPAKFESGRKRVSSHGPANIGRVQSKQRTVMTPGQLEHGPE